MYTDVYNIHLYAFISLLIICIFNMTCDFLEAIMADECLHVNLCSRYKPCCKLNGYVQIQGGINIMIKAGSLSLIFSKYCSQGNEMQRIEKQELDFIHCNQTGMVIASHNEAVWSVCMRIFSILKEGCVCLHMLGSTSKPTPPILLHL